MFSCGVKKKKKKKKKGKAGDRRKIESYWWKKKRLSLVPEIIKNHRHVLLVVAYPSTEISISNGRIFGGEGIFFMRAEKEKSVKYLAAEFSKKKKKGSHENSKFLHRKIYIY